LRITPVSVPRILDSLPLDGLLRIDAALEGDWSSTVRTVWFADTRCRSLEDHLPTHPAFKPSLELYFDGWWVGSHCYRREGGLNVFDKEAAHAIVDFIENRLGGAGKRD
jgi:hypothetical protein